MVREDGARERPVFFVDFDGTITDIDTFDALVRHAAGDDAWNALDRALMSGQIPLREALARQAALVRLSRGDAHAFLAGAARVDPTFAPFVEAAQERGVEVVVVSSGITSVIRAALTAARVTDIPVYANEVDYARAGWTMTFIDDSTNGHDKAARVRAARNSGARTAYAGDGMSDEEAALVAERRFAKRGKRLERYLAGAGVPFVAFDAFAELVPVLDELAAMPNFESM